VVQGRYDHGFGFSLLRRFDQGVEGGGMTVDLFHVDLGKCEAFFIGIGRQLLLERADVVSGRERPRIQIAE